MIAPQKPEPAAAASTASFGPAGLLDEPDWRWKMVLLSVDRGVAPDGQDEWVQAAYTFINALQHAHSAAAIAHVKAVHCAVLQALTVREGDPAKRAKVEAALCCNDASLMERAAFLGLQQAVLETFGKLFFDIEPLRGSPGGLIYRLFTVDDLNGNQPTALYIGWKLTAIFGGFEVLCAALEYGGSGPAEAFHRKAGISAALRNFGLGAFFMSVNSSTARRIEKIVLRLMEVEERINGLVKNNAARSPIEGVLVSRPLLTSDGPEVPNEPAARPDAPVEALSVQLERPARPDAIVQHLHQEGEKVVLSNTPASGRPRRQISPLRVNRRVKKPAAKRVQRKPLTPRARVN